MALFKERKIKRFPFGRKTVLVGQVKSYCLVWWWNPRATEQFTVYAPPLNPSTTAPETRSPLLWLTCVNRVRCMGVSAFVHISPSLTPFQWTSARTEHNSWLKVGRGNKVSAGSLVHVCECEQVHRLYGEIINLVTQLKTESAPIRAVGFTWAFYCIKRSQ